jgi:hypothetical protein
MVTIYVNHLGFTPGGAKFCLLGGPRGGDFTVCELESGLAVYSGQFNPAPGDFGMYCAGDFSDFEQPGVYILRAGMEHSQPFRIAADVYQEALEKVNGYFKLQRCGDSTQGWNGPCHLDDGKRGDSGEHQDVSGGWHDACDLRKWVGATIYGMLGLAKMDEFSPGVEEELRWGNRYFLAMQEPAGYLMNYIGGDYFVHGDNNRWTDNIADGRDDRVIDVNPCDPLPQWVFVQAESILAARLKSSDPGYSLMCLSAARRCAGWLLKERQPYAAAELGAGISALLALRRASGDEELMGVIVSLAERLLSLQVTRQVDSHSIVWGFFWQRKEGISPSMVEPYKDIWGGCWPLIGLCDLLEEFPEHEQAPAWKESIRLFCEHYLQALAGRNAFAIVPYGLYRNDPGGRRSLGRFGFRYFYEENPGWYVGINSNLASTGIGLLKAARLLKRPDWAALAQRQLDWIVGVNPFNASTIMAVGYNNPQHMFGGEYDPPTPFLPGAVMNGISGDGQDMPQLKPGSYQECEYWTPMVCFSMWLLQDLQAKT